MDALLVVGIVLLVVAAVGIAALVVLMVVARRRGDTGEEQGQVEPSLDDTCLACVRPLAPTDEVAAMNERAVLAFLGELPEEPPAYTDPLGNDRWFVHVACAADFLDVLDSNDSDDSACASCGEEVDPDDREPALDALTERLGDAARTPMMASAMAGVHDATRAWRCEACGSWMCNDCVVAELTTEPAGRLAPHEDCGGTFHAPRT